MTKELKARILIILVEYELKRGESNVEDWMVSQIENLIDEHRG